MEFRLKYDFEKTDRDDLEAFGEGEGANGALDNDEKDETHIRGLVTIGSQTNGLARVPQIQDSISGDFLDWDGTIGLEYDRNNDTYKPRDKNITVRFWPRICTLRPRRSSRSRN